MRVRPVIADQRAEIGDAGQRADILDRDQVADVPGKCVDDERITKRTQRVQRPGNTPCKVAILENVGLEFEHEQQDDPGRGVDGRRVSIDDVAESNSVGV